MASAADLAPCSSCAAVEANTSTRDAIEEIDQDTLRGFQSEIARIDKGGVRHAVDIADLIGEYDLPEKQRCSYFNHRHNHGILVLARCGKLLAIGTTCGSKTVDGFDTLQSEMRIAHEVSRERRLSQSEPAKILDEVERLGRAVESRLEGLEGLREYCPEVFREMQNACLRGTRTVQVRRTEFDRRAMDARDRYETKEIKGLSLFDGSFLPRKLATLLGGARAYVKCSAEVLATRENRKQLRNDRLRWQREVQRVKAWLEETGNFWSEQNLGYVLLKTFDERLPGFPMVEGATIRTGTGLLIGIDGVIESD